MNRARVAASAMLVVGVLTGWQGTGSAVDPEKSGWWARYQAAPEPVPVTAPGPPTVPQGGLHVANAPDGPAAYAALLYPVPGPATATLTLKVADATPTDVPGGSKSGAQLARLAACVIDGDWDPPPPGQPGSWESRPAYDTTTCTLGQFDSEFRTLTFNLFPSLQTIPTLYNLAIVPDPDPTLPEEQRRQPFSLSFERATYESFEIDEVLAPPEEEEELPPPVDYVPPSDEPVVPSALPVDSGTFPAVAVTTTTAAPVSTRANLPPRRARPVVNALPPDTRGEQLMAVSLLLALLVAWWWVGGQQTPSPRLIGSMGGGAGAAAGGAALRPRPGSAMAGIGRFARPRSGRPRRLI